MLFIKKYETVGSLRVKSRDHVIYKIKEILVVTLSPYNTSVKEEDYLNNIDINNEIISSNETSYSNLISLNAPVNNFLKSTSFSTIQQLLDTSPYKNLNLNTAINTTSPSPTNTVTTNQTISKFEKNQIFFLEFI